MDLNLISKIADEISGSNTAINKEAVKRLLPQDYRKIKETVEERLCSGNFTLIEEKIVRFSYEIAADLLEERGIDITNDRSDFAKKVRLVFNRKGDVGFIQYESVLSPELIEESIKGFCRKIVKGRQIWEVNPSLIYHKKFTLEVLDPKEGENILDLGCGHGSFVVYCSMLGANCIGIDYAPSTVKSANEYLRSKGLNGQVKLGDIECLDFADSSFDKIVSSDLYEHLIEKSKIRMLKEAYRVLKPGGFLLVKTPNLSYLRLSVIFKKIMAILKFKNPFKIKIPHTTKDPEGAMHIGLTTISRLEQDLNQTDFFQCEVFYNLGTKFDKRFPTLNRLLTRDLPFIRDFFTEEIIIKATKSKLADFLPD